MVPDIGVVALSITAVAIVYAPIAWFTRPDDPPPAEAWLSVVALAFLCTALAFIVFFRLIAAIGPARSTLITFINPAVAVVVGALVLDEEITWATVGGFVLVVSGCWLATRQETEVIAEAPIPLEPTATLRTERSADGRARAGEPCLGVFDDSPHHGGRRLDGADGAAGLAGIVRHRRDVTSRRQQWVEQRGMAAATAARHRCRSHRRRPRGTP